MKLRNAHLAVVERQKFLDDVLNASHSDNGGKAKFFASLGLGAVTRTVSGGSESST